MADQNDRKQAGLLLHQSEITSVPGTKDPTGQRWRGTEPPRQPTPAKAGAGTFVHPHGNAENTTDPL